MNSIHSKVELSWEDKINSGNPIKLEDLDSKVDSFYKHKNGLSGSSAKLTLTWWEKMLKNSYKTITEKNKPMLLETAKQDLSALSSENSQPLSFSIGESKDQGTRSYMEDRHFHVKNERGLLFGVFDGHGGENVAEYANKQFPELFWIERGKTANISEVFNNVNNKIQEEVKQDESLNHSGTTATVCFIDKENYIYTSTLGDSEAYIYRKIKDIYRFIPLSCVRDWKFIKECRRAQEKKAKIIQNINESRCQIKTSSINHSTNVSRAIGDCYSQGVLSHKSKNTINKVLPGDVIVMGSDGLWNSLKQNQIINEIRNEINGDDNHLAKNLVEKAKEQWNKSKIDNITVMTIKVQSVINSEN